MTIVVVSMAAVRQADRVARCWYNSWELTSDPQGREIERQRDRVETETEIETEKQ